MKTQITSMQCEDLSPVLMEPASVVLAVKLETSIEPLARKHSLHMKREQPGATKLLTKLVFKNPETISAVKLCTEILAAKRPVHRHKDIVQREDGDIANRLF